MKLGELREQDIPVLHDLYDQLIGCETDIEDMKRVLKEVEGDDHYILFCVYDENDTLAATACLTRCFDLTGDARYYYNMENFVVDKGHKRQGYGSFLMKAVEDYVQKHNGSYINFTSSSTRHEAHAFYEKMGYKSDYVKGFKKGF